MHKVQIYKNNFASKFVHGDRKNVFTLLILKFFVFFFDVLSNLSLKQF